MLNGRRSQLVVISTTLSVTLGCGGLLGGRGPEGGGGQHSGPRTNLYFQADGSCEQYTDIDCPPPEVATCNPPMPEPVPCPPTQIREIARGEDGVCRQKASVTSCPPDTSCGEPPEQITDCPPVLAALEGAGTLHKTHAYGCGLSAAERWKPVSCPPEMEAPPRDDYTFTVIGDGLCRAFAKDSGHCPPGASCNPPPPQEVVCPPGVE